MAAMVSPHRILEVSPPMTRLTPRMVPDPSMSDNLTGKFKCTVEGCENRSRYRLYCGKHRYRARRYGDPTVTSENPPGMMREWLEARAKWQEVDNCLIWPFSVDRGGYPVCGAVKGHTLMCELSHGPKPMNKQVAAHSCDVRNCVNPNHLRWATYKENSDDAVARERTTRGEAVWTAKLTEQQVREIRRAERGYGKTKALAEKYGVSIGTINHIWRGGSWRHVE